MEKIIYLKVVGKESPKHVSPRETTMNDTLLMEEKVKGLAKLVNVFANTDHQEIHLFQIAHEEGHKDFKESDLRGARIGYAFDSLTQEIYFGFAGEINVQTAERILIKEGYDVQEVVNLPGAYDFSRRFVDRDDLTCPEDTHRDSYRITNDELAERLAIEKRHAGVLD